MRPRATDIHVAAYYVFYSNEHQTFFELFWVIVVNFSFPFMTMMETSGYTT